LLAQLGESVQSVEARPVGVRQAVLADSSREIDGSSARVPALLEVREGRFERREVDPTASGSAEAFYAPKARIRI
jgi:hypothetical protein